MLTGKKITFTSKSVVDEVEIASFGAVLNVDTNDLSIYSRPTDKDACKKHRDVVRADQATFEDFAYGIQDLISKDSD